MTQYLDQSKHIADLESELCLLRYKLKQAEEERDAALDYIEHVDTCASCDAALMGPQPGDTPAHCEYCHPDEDESANWHEKHQRLRKLVDDAQTRRTT